MNSITIAGQLGKDAELSSLPNGGEVILKFSVADSQGREKPTIWWNCTLWGKRATSLQQYLTKGHAVTVTGVVTMREYTDKDGQARKSQEIRVNDVALQGGKPYQGEAPRPAARAPAERPSAAGSGFDDMDDDIPF